MADYEAISKAVSTAVKREVDKQIKAAYQHGYEKGYSEEYEARQSAVDIAYKRGLNDAWKCARKLSHTRPQAEWNKLCELFGVAENRAYTIFEKCTATEAIAKIKEYEEKQTEKSCDTCDNQNKTIGCLKHIDCQRNNFKHYEPKQTETKDCKTCMYWDEPCDNCCEYDKYVPKYIEKDSANAGASDLANAIHYANKCLDEAQVDKIRENQTEKSYRNNKYYNTFPTSKETADEIKAEYDEETRSYTYTVEGEKEWK